MKIASIQIHQHSDVTILLGRILLVAVFFIGGFGLFYGNVPVAYAASKGMPAFLVWFGYGIKFFAGLAVILGFMTRLATFGLIAFTITTAVVFHPYPDPLFMKELSMTGGLFVLLSTGAGSFSLDAMLHKRPKS